MRGSRNANRTVGIASLILGMLWVGSSLIGCWSGGSEEVDAGGGDQVVAWVQRDHEGYVGNDACRRCHEAICDSYLGHPMAQAMEETSGLANAPEYDVESLRFTSAPYLEYDVVEEDGRVIHRERLIDQDGATLVEQREPIVFAMGSGARGRSYAIERGGFLFMSPLSWYSTQGKWDLSPGYEPVNHPQFSRPIADRCLRCHCGQPAEISGGSLQVPSYEKPFVVEHGISCERCHGPAADHIDFHDSGTVAGKTDPIVNPVDLSPDQRDDVCNQCHLQGKGEVLRPGRHPSDFRPGDRVGDIWTVFLDGTSVESDQSTKAVSHVQQMQSSRCYLESGKKLACVSCHDPHGMPTEVEKPAFFRESCLACHGNDDCHETEARRQATSPSDHCVSCHMPRLEANDIPHTTQTDHRILARPSEGVESSPNSSAELFADRWTIYGGDSMKMPEPEIQRAIGLALAQAAGESGNSTEFEAARAALEKALPSFSEDDELAAALALCHYRLENAERAEELWLDTLERSPSHEESLLNLGTYYQNGGKLALARPLLSDYVAARPYDTDALFQLSLLEGQLLHMEEAIALAERAKTLNPRRWEVYRWLVDLYEGTGQKDKSEPLQKVLDQVSAGKLRRSAPN